MTKGFTLVYIFIAIGVLSSCGVRKNSSISLEDKVSLMKASQAAVSCTKINESELVKSSRKLISEIESKANLNGRQYLLNTNRYFIEQGNMFSPLVLGKKTINKVYKDLSEQLESSKTNNARNFNWNDLLQKKDFFTNMIDRWTFHQCHLTGLVTNSNQEMSDFLSIESQFCKKSCLTGSDSRLIEKEEKEIRRKVINMCSLIKRKSLCSVEYDLSVIHKKRNTFIENILIESREHYKKELFSPKKSNLNITCQKKKNHVLLNFPIEQSSLSYERTQAIKKYWENEKVKVEFRVEEGGLSISSTPETVSYVSSERPNHINLSFKLFGEIKSKTIAHEFGHVLGFRDCYIEYFNGRTDEVVYFELEREQGNLMCSLVSGKKIPNKYQDTLIEKYCN